NYKMTIGVDFSIKNIYICDELLTVNLWDIAGQERFANMTRVYYQDASAAIIVFDISKPDSLQSVLPWKKDIRSKVTLPDGSDLPIVLIGNKTDKLPEGEIIEIDKIEEFCKEHGFLFWSPVSAKSG